MGQLTWPLPTVGSEGPDPEAPAQWGDGVHPLDPGVAGASPLYRRLAFVLAPPGSGGDVVASVLSGLPGAVDRSPLRAFSQGLGRVLANFHVSSRVGAHNGLSALADEQQVLAAVRALADTVLAAGDAELLVDYTDDQARWAQLIASLYPDACLVHVVRSPLDCVDGNDREVRAKADAWVDAHQAVLRVPFDANVVRIDFPQLGTAPEQALAPLLARLGRETELAPAVARVNGTAVTAKAAPSGSARRIILETCTATAAALGLDLVTGLPDGAR